MRPADATLRKVLAGTLFFLKVACLSSCGGGSGSTTTASPTPTPTPAPVPGSCAPSPSASLVVNVRDAPYGAMGDGATNDTDAIQKAVNAVAGTGGTVQIPRGTYMIDAVATSPGYGIRLGNNMTLRLEPGATLKAQTNASAGYIMLLASGVSHVNIVGGGTIQGDLATHAGTAGEGGYCLQLSNGASNIVVADITAREGWGDGFYVSGASNILFCNVTADHNRRQGMSIVDGNHLTIKNSTFTRTVGYADTSGALVCGTGLDIEPNPGQTVSDVLISGCTFSDNLGGGISSGLSQANAGVAFTHDIVIDGNKVTGNGSTSRPRPGIEISGQTSLQRISNNLVDGNTSMGIYLRGGATDIQVTGNTVNNTHASPGTTDVVFRAGYGILVAYLKGITVTGNVGSGNDGCGVCDLNPSGTNTVSGNAVSGKGSCP
ncbi:right-handed parallel beta-helix repeat-containing protein [Geothrix sp. PMB-07]|uniref:right-handed parallel beta-helix repeat-containing protein n=1 Tax=Geothrix sp. PMB-07 TaxID=3068640 RepID=UPI002741BF2E|nr:right-handed parallel beta-helix repeat-containing protein [Geothrix sp. PMB-07]WLT33050.1 right-handed parallel beta-helix repeat-containing protein [Geothrix sp. PMB-07]